MSDELPYPPLCMRHRLLIAAHPHVDGCRALKLLKVDWEAVGVDAPKVGVDDMRDTSLDDKGTRLKIRRHKILKSGEKKCMQFYRPKKGFCCTQLA